MRRIIILCAVLAALHLRAQESGFGAGFIAGEPTGLSLKAWLDGEKAIDFGVAWSFVGDGHVHLHGDLLFHRFEAIKVNKGKLPVYFGPGLRLLFDDEEQDIGFRIVGGVDYLFADAPLDAFLELAPGLDLIEDTDLFFNGGLGLRYWF